MLGNPLHAIAEITIYVTPEMTAQLSGTEIHPVYSTFWLAYHAECAARKAIEPYFEAGENAVGSALELRHEAMTPVGAAISVTARVTEVTGNRIVCSIEARKEFGGKRIRVASGSQTQTVLPQTVLDALIRRAYGEDNEKRSEERTV